jgi:hypothetical protein
MSAFYHSSSATELPSHGWEPSGGCIHCCIAGLLGIVNAAILSLVSPTHVPAISRLARCSNEGSSGWLVGRLLIRLDTVVLDQLRRPPHGEPAVLMKAVGVVVPTFRLWVRVHDGHASQGDGPVVPRISDKTERMVWRGLIWRAAILVGLAAVFVWLAVGTHVLVPQPPPGCFQDPGISGCYESTRLEPEPVELAFMALVWVLLGWWLIHGWRRSMTRQIFE